MPNAGIQRVALIGFGAIGRVVAQHLLAGEGESPLALVLVRPEYVAEARATLPLGISVVTELEDLLILRPPLVVECAGQGAVRSLAADILAAGIDLVVISTGALAEPDLFRRLLSAAARAGSRILIPAGAIAGLDGLGALKRAGLTKVVYTSIKPPGAWIGTRAERLLNLAALRERTIIFEGSAGEAALHYPRNANLAATVALAGLGFEETMVCLVADPTAQEITGVIEAESVVGTMRLVMSGPASANTKTSASTAYSILHTIRSRGATLVI